jgi:hypothetical protein
LSLFPRRASVLAYITNQLLHSHHAIDRKRATDLANGPLTIDFGDFTRPPTHTWRITPWTITNEPPHTPPPPTARDRAGIHSGRFTEKKCARLRDS